MPTDSPHRVDQTPTPQARDEAAPPAPELAGNSASFVPDTAPPPLPVIDLEPLPVLDPKPDHKQEPEPEPAGDEEEEEEEQMVPVRQPPLGLIVDIRA